MKILKLKIKKLTSILLAVILTAIPAAVAPLSANAAVSGDLRYELLGDGTAEITGYAGQPTEITIPDELDGYKVTSIGESAFYNCKSLVSVTVGNCVKNIGVGAFSGCNSLESLTISDSVTNIDSSAFLRCTALTDITIPGNVKKIGGSAFRNCTGLKSIKISEGAADIGAYAFYNCTSLKSIVIPDSVTNIGSNAFGHHFDGFTIFGYAGTAAESYANENGFIFVSLDGQDKDIYVYSDDETNISIIVCNDAEFTVEKTTDSKSLSGINNALADGEELLEAYNISLLSGADEVQPDGKATLRIPAEYKNIKVCRFDSDGTLTDTNATFENNYMVFETDRLGTFAIVQKKTGEPVDGFSYKICDDATAEITAYTGNASAVKIPGGISGYPVTSVAESAFENCGSIAELTIPEGITRIGRYAFRGCTNLETVYYNAQDCVIDTYSGDVFFDFAYYSAFDGCTSFTTLYIGENVKSISEFAFANCTSLETVYYNAENCLNANSYETYLEGIKFTPAFQGCTSFSTLYIGKYVQSIPDYLFVSCESLKTVYFNAVNCTDMTSNHLADRTHYPENGENYDSTDLFNNSVFKKCSSLTTVIFADDVRTIPAYAFYDCTALTDVTVPKSVTDIGEYALGYVYKTYPIYYKDSGLIRGYKYVDEVDPGYIIYGYTGTEAQSYADGNGITFIEADKKEERTFTDENTGISVTVADDGTAQVTEYTGTSAELEIPAEINGYPVTGISEYVFYNCTTLTKLTIPDSVKSVGAHAFQGCINLTSITIPDSVTSLGTAVFSRCTGVTDIYIGIGVTVIPDYAFSSAVKLKNLTVGNNVEIIGDYAFYNCTQLFGISIPDSVRAIGNSAFKGCASLESIVIPAGVTSIEGHTFEDCASLKEATIPENVTVINSAAFSGCTSLESITVPDSVTDIGSYAFGYYYEADEYKKIDGFTILGYTASAAESYAGKNGFKFIALDDDPADDPVEIGNVNGDGILDVNDVTYLQKFLAGYSDSPIDLSDSREFATADFNGDGIVDVNDVTAIQMKLAGYSL